MRRSPLLLALLLGACGCPSSADLVRQIEALGAGGRLEIPSECVVSDAVTVPAGATVSGGTFELALGEAITLAPSGDAALPTTLTRAVVRGGSGGASVRVIGDGHARVEACGLEIARGIAIGASGATVAVVETTITGNVDPARVIELPVPAPPESLATFGVAAIEGAHVTISGGATELVASAGALCTGATLDITGATIARARGVGVWASDCTLTVQDTTIDGTISAPTLPGIGIAALDATTLDATDLAMHAAPGYGVFASASAVTLRSPRLESLGQAGAWAEDGASLIVIDGAITSVSGAAIAAVGASRLEVRGSSIERTRGAPLPTRGGGGADTMADAIHVAQLAATPCTVTLADLVLVDNDRVGLVLDGGGAPLALSITSTRIETSGTQLGAVAQDVASLPAGWDAEVTRVGSAATLDPGAGPLPVSDGAGAMGILMPPTIML